MPEAFIVDAVRAPIGRRGGGLSQIHPADLGAHVLRALMDRTGIDPGTVEDVIFSFEMLVKHHPGYSGYYRHVTKTEKTGDRDVTFTFDQPGNRELPLIVGELTILPKHWWEGSDASGKKRASPDRNQLTSSSVPRNRPRSTSPLTRSGCNCA